MKLKHFIESQQLDQELIFDFFKNADRIRNNEYTGNELRGKVLCTLFYEPSTRTRLSFESAMLKLGGNVVSTENAREFSSAVKGESLEDTIRIISGYSDCIAVRHYEDGAAQKAVKVSDIPIINAGDGKGQHPTQALLDIYTIYKEIGRLNNFKVAITGDLASGRTARSLCYLLGKFKGVEIVFVSPENLRIKEDIKDYLIEHNVKFREESNLNLVLPETDIIYITRIQKERMSLKDYGLVEDKQVLDIKNLNLLRKNARILHPLPHVEEIDLPVETEKNDERVAYFRQARNGLYIRMALLLHLLS